ncbi:hypothetical protein Q8A73_012658 [Channa argus]|nr:hypothetical protein Q8A73_012658 [Channa argus]
MALNSSSSSLKNVYHCVNSSAANIVSISFIITHIFLLLPLSLIISYLGYQQWWRQRSFSTTSHSDIFTYHAAAMELIFAVGGVLYCCGLYTAFSDLMTVGFFATSIFFSGQISLHILTCIERYVAVVHPVNYMGLRQSGRVKLSLSVLYVLIRPRPGEIGILVSVGLESSKLLSYEDGCILLMLGYWFSLPSSSVLPLLFLHRAGKLEFCHCSSDDIQDCSKATGEFAMTIAFMITNFSLLLPLCLFILYLGHQRWRRQSTFATSSHSDVFTYHFAAMELIFADQENRWRMGRADGWPNQSNELSPLSWL